MLLQVPRGTKDILPEETPVWQEVESKARRIFSLYNYAEIRTPVFENVTLFKRALGDVTDIVQKQMFVFKQGDDHFVLRPEATASIARAYLENNLGFGVKLRKLFYIGPMFRAERPQKGRLRQFHHIGVEAIGLTNPNLDIEVIELADKLLREFGISNYKFVINSLGCVKDKAKFADLLKQALAKHKKVLCKDCQKRITKNVFRVLDCKNEKCKEITHSLKIGQSYLCGDCKSHFDKVLKGLDKFGIKYEVKEQLVRGLDYYSGVVFEVVHPDLGAQDALGAGGRYDYLFKELANKEIGAVGFAFGEERLMLALPKKESSKKLNVYVMSLGDKAADKSLELVKNLRSAGVSCDFDYSDGSLKSKLNEANKLGARFAIIIGDDEINKGKLVVKFMQEGKQEEVEFVNAVGFIKNILKE
ncbi:MAG: histidine--tRNA ligase [Candidatus Omnitrophica bacterium]|nr:histidine--tRNA ligase [Candidatus Omnitrophota bacterium]MDD5352528.1 histidine--tRNA ligase [Candidatus Omnitrophota bacterium]MDD5550126.1 histidine--tRNA ligase [Candidatus Omnitrophota bacterium]